MSRFLPLRFGCRGPTSYEAPNSHNMFSFSFIQQVFFSIYYVSGMVAGAQEIDYLTVGSPYSSRGHV